MLPHVTPEQVDAFLFASSWLLIVFLIGGGASIVLQSWLDRGKKSEDPAWAEERPFWGCMFIALGAVLLFALWLLHM